MVTTLEGNSIVFCLPIYSSSDICYNNSDLPIGQVNLAYPILAYPNLDYPNLDYPNPRLSDLADAGEVRVQSNYS